MAAVSTGHKNSGTYPESTVLPVVPRDDSRDDIRVVRVFSKADQLLYSAQVMRDQAALSILLSSGIHYYNREMEHAGRLLQKINDADPSNEQLPCRPHRENYLVNSDVLEELSKKGWTGHTVEYNVDIWSNGVDRVTLDNYEPFLVEGVSLCGEWAEATEISKAALEAGKDGLRQLFGPQDFPVLADLLNSTNDWGIISFESMNAACVRAHDEVKLAIAKYLGNC